ncbi:hypothetical protein EV424DRAFT_1088896 [Suillus variegatus]|nr:hypothetical protein EV424DRAFT_1088896 [Suillus variegatus]
MPRFTIPGGRNIGTIFSLASPVLPVCCPHLCVIIVVLDSDACIDIAILVQVPVAVLSASLFSSCHLCLLSSHNHHPSYCSSFSQVTIKYSSKQSCSLMLSCFTSGIYRFSSSRLCFLVPSYSTSCSFAPIAKSAGRDFGSPAVHPIHAAEHNSPNAVWACAHTHR